MCSFLYEHDSEEFNTSFVICSRYFRTYLHILLYNIPHVIKRFVIVLFGDTILITPPFIVNSVDFILRKSVCTFKYTEYKRERGRYVAIAGLEYITIIRFCFVLAIFNEGAYLTLKSIFQLALNLRL